MTQSPCKLPQHSPCKLCSKEQGLLIGTYLKQLQDVLSGASSGCFGCDKMAKIGYCRVILKQPLFTAEYHCHNIKKGPNKPVSARFSPSVGLCRFAKGNIYLAKTNIRLLMKVEGLPNEQTPLLARFRPCKYMTLVILSSTNVPERATGQQLCNLMLSII